MAKKRHNLSKIVICCIFTTLAMGAYGQGFKAFGSGWTFDSEEADANGDMEGGIIGLIQGHGSFGFSTGSASHDFLPWDGVSFCDFDSDTGEPRGILIAYFSNSNIFRFANGDLLYLRMSASPASTLCFNIIDNQSATFEFYNDVVGGTGRFEGATGSLVTTGSGTFVAQGYAGIEFETKGEIIRETK